MDQLLRDLRGIGLEVTAAQAQQVVQASLRYALAVTTPAATAPPPVPSRPPPVPSRPPPTGLPAVPPPAGPVAPIQPIVMGEHKYPFLARQPFSLVVTDALARRKYIGDTLAVGPYPAITKELVTKMVGLYDQFFFAGLLNAMLSLRRAAIHINISDTLTSTGGRVSWDDGIRFDISGRIINAITPTTIAGKMAGGIVAQDRLHALQLVVEHELVHALITLDGSAVTEPSHGPLFKAMLQGLYGQKTCSHGLCDSLTAPTTSLMPPAVTFQESLTKSLDGAVAPDTATATFLQDLAATRAQRNVGSRPVVGDKIYYTNKHGVTHYGRVTGTRGTVNAKVLRDDGQTYNVPYGMLRIIQ